MFGGVSAPFIHRPVATTLLMVAILLVGLVAYPNLAVAPLPQVDFPTITVAASLPGASPETMAASVAQPLERQIAQIPGVTQMTSTSSLGATAIAVQFDLNRNIDAAANDIQAAINAAAGQLPKDLPSPPTYRKVNPSDTPILILSVRSDVEPIIDVDDVAENILAQRISQISGVSLVRVGGQQTPAIRIQIDPAKLVEKGLQLEDVRQQIGIATVDSPKGALIGPKQTFTIYDNDQLTVAQPWNDVIVAYRNGAPVRVRDIGRAEAGPADTTQAAWSNGKSSVFLVIWKQPGANVIDTVEAIKRALGPLQAAIPHDIQVKVLSDRTLTIRASVRDVEFTLMLTVALVVMVIFVFLRSVWTTVIPAVTIPLALLGACALMWAVGYSLDNLSLMAFTIAVGFVVDDAIVMLENITRHVEEGERPFEAALKGSGEIGFTIISMSTSLIAVLMPLLMMSGLIGRLFREFSVTIAMTIAVSALVSLTLSPMMASRFLKSRDEERHGRLYKLSEKGFVTLARAYERGLDFVLRHRFATLMTFIATVVATVYLFVEIPKGFFPQQDTGVLYGTTEAAQDVSFPEMYRLQEEAGKVVMADPAVETMGMGLGAGVGTTGQNQGRMFITLKPEDERDVSIFQVISRLRPKLAQIKGLRTYLFAAQDVTVGARFAKTQFQYTLQDANLDELNAWAPKILDKLKSLAELRDVATDQENAGTTLTLKIDRDMASRFGIQPQLIDDTLYDAFGQREVTQYFTQVNTYWVVEEVLPSLQGDPATLDKIYIRSPTTGQMVPLSAFAKWTTNPVAPLSISHQGQFPAITISFNLAEGVALGTATAAVQHAEQRIAAAAGAHDDIPGQRSGVRGIAGHRPAAHSGGAGFGLSDPRRALRELHPPAHHSLYFAFGRGGRDRDADAVRLRVQSRCAHRRHSPDRHRKEERHHDGRFRHRRRTGRRPPDGRGDPRGGAAAVPADHDDDHGGAAWLDSVDAQSRLRIGNAPAARLHHVRRPTLQPGSDAVYNSRNLPVPRPPVALALRRVRQVQAAGGEGEKPRGELEPELPLEPAWAEARAKAAE